MKPTSALHRDALLTPFVLALTIGAAVGCTATSRVEPDPSAGLPSGASGKADDDPGDATPAATSELRFGASFEEVRPTAPIYAGEVVRLRFDPQRFYQIINASAGGGYGSYGYFASAHHCYGYGCCDVTFPEINVHFRFEGLDDGSWQDGTLGDDNQVDLGIPAEATALDVYFDTPGYDLKTWYCGCDEACAQANRDAATTQNRDFSAWDSRYGANYRFPIEQARELPAIRFAAGYQQSVTGDLAAGSAVLIQYDESRMYDIVNWSSGSGRYFSSNHHCYGYGCCDVAFPDLSVFYRGTDDGAYVEVPLDDAGEAAVEVPADANRLELFFAASSYDITTWYCGCESACAEQNRAAATPTTVPFSAWDSDFGRNYAFPL